MLLPLIPLWKAVFSSAAIGPWDQIRQMAPWGGPVPNQPWDVLQADGALQFYVWRDLVFHSWAKLQVPFWNPYELAGTPLLANSQSAALYPFHVLVGLLHLPTSLGITLLAWLHLALAGIGVYRLTKTLGGSDTGALLAGASFALCPFLVSWTALASVLSTVCWIPWAMAHTLDVLTPRLAEEEVRRSHRPVGWLALCVGMMLLAGHLQFVAYGFIALVLTTAFQLKGRAPKQIGAWVIAMAAGVAIASPQLIPVLEYGQYSHRKNIASAEGYAGYAASAIQPWQFGNLVNPLGLGDPRESVGETHLSSYWPMLAKRGDNFAESAVSPGAVCLAFLCLLPFVWKQVNAWAMVAVGATGLLLATPTPLTQAMYFLVPSWSSTGSPGRAIVLFLLAVSVLSGLAASVLFDPERRPTKPRTIQLAAMTFAFVTVISLALGPMGAHPYDGVPAELFNSLVGVATAGGLMLTLVLAFLGVQPLLFGYFRSRPPAGGVSGSALVLAGVIGCSLMGGAHRLVMAGTPVEFQNDVGFKRVAIINSVWDLVSAAPAAMPPNLAALFRVHELGGYDSLVHRDTVALLEDIDRANPSPAANGNMMFVKPRADMEKLANAGVSEVWTRDQAGSFIRTPVTGPGRATISNGPAEILEEDLQSISVKALGPGTLTLRDRMMPGWWASIDGVKVPLANGTWRQVDVPEGEHTVVFRYQPPKFGTLVWLSLIALVWAGVLAFRRTHKRPGMTAIPLAEGAPA